MAKAIPLVLSSISMLLLVSACKAPDADLTPIRGAGGDPTTLPTMNAGSPGKALDFDFSPRKYIKRDVPPEFYPADALQQHIEGIVFVNVEIDIEGILISAKPVSGPKIFHSSAMKYLHSLQFDPSKDRDTKAIRFATFSISFKLPNAQSQ